MNEDFKFVSDVALSSRCMDVLVQNVGLLETERFIAHLSRESTDYTKWRQDQFEDMSLEELGNATRESGKTVKGTLKVREAMARLAASNRQPAMA